MNFIDEWKLAIGTKMPMISRPLLKPCAIKTRRENSERKKKENYKPIIESKFIKIAMANDHLFIKSVIKLHCFYTIMKTF